jgi:hypothetical protein
MATHKAPRNRIDVRAGSRGRSKEVVVIERVYTFRRKLSIYDFATGKAAQAGLRRWAASLPAAHLLTKVIEREVNPLSLKHPAKYGFFRRFSEAKSHDAGEF